MAAQYTAIVALTHPTRGTIQPGETVDLSHLDQAAIDKLISRGAVRAEEASSKFNAYTLPGDNKLPAQED